MAAIDAASEENAATPPTRDELIAEALDYNRQGHSVKDIAEAMGLTVLEVNELISEGLQQLLIDPPMRRRLTDLDRVNKMLPNIIAGAVSGDQQAIGLALQLMDRRARLEADLFPSISVIFPDYRPAPDPQEKRAPGRPGHKPTEATAYAVQCMVVGGASHEHIARVLHISKTTLYKHYRHILDTALTQDLVEIGYQTMTRAKRGSIADAHYVLRTRGKDMGWGEKASLEHTGANGQPLPSGVHFTIEFVDAPAGSMAGQEVEQIGSPGVIDAVATEVTEDAGSNS